MNYDKIIKPNTFIYNYLEYCKDINSPKIYDFWCALFILSMISNRWIKIDKPNDPLYPNLFITLIGDEINVNKDLTINRCLILLNNILNYQEDKVNLITEKINKPRLEYILTQKSFVDNTTIIGVIDKNIKDYYSCFGLIDLFSDLYSCPDERSYNGSTTNADIRYDNVFISCLCGDTADNFVNLFNKNKTEYSYLSKSIPIFAKEGKRRNAWGNRSQSKEELIKQGKTIKENIKKSRKYTTLSSDTIRYYNNWYRKRKYKQINTSIIKNFYNIEADLVLKIALLLKINNNDGKLTEKDNIFIEDIKNAIEIITDIRNLYKKSITSLLDNKENNEFDKIINKLINIIHSYGQNGIRRRELYNKMKYHCSREDFDYIINTLHELECIEVLEDFNKSTIYYRETDKLLNFDLKLFKNLV